MLPVRKYAGTFIITLNVLFGFALFNTAPPFWQSYDRVINEASKIIKDSGAVSEEHLVAYSVSNAWSPPYDMDQSATPLDVIQDYPRQAFRPMLQRLCRWSCALLLLNSIFVLWCRGTGSVPTNRKKDPS